MNSTKQEETQDNICLNSNSPLDYRFFEFIFRRWAFLCLLRSERDGLFWHGSYSCRHPCKLKRTGSNSTENREQETNSKTAENWLKFLNLDKARSRSRFPLVGKHVHLTGRLRNVTRMRLRTVTRIPVTRLRGYQDTIFGMHLAGIATAFLEKCTISRNE